MSEEEKQAIEYWKTHMEILHCNTQIASEHYIKVLLNLVDKQQKEIENLKSKKYILNAETNEIKEIPISDDYISKAKIKEIISKYVDIEEHLVYHHQELWGADLAQMIKELLGE